LWQAGLGARLADDCFASRGFKKNEEI